MVDAALASFYVLAEKERELTEARAHIRDLQARLGEADDATGKYWLQRTARLEHVHDAALRAIKAEPGFVELADACEAVETLPAPACRDGDHFGKVAA